MQSLAARELLVDYLLTGLTRSANDVIAYVSVNILGSVGVYFSGKK